MTQEQREKLVFCTGVLSGLGWLVKDAPLADALQSVQEDIEMFLKEYGEHECRSCRYSDRPAIDEPCRNCMRSHTDLYVRRVKDENA